MPILSNDEFDALPNAAGQANIDPSRIISNDEFNALPDVPQSFFSKVGEAMRYAATSPLENAPEVARGILKSGALPIGGAVVGGALGGPAGAAVGASLGKTAELASEQIPGEEPLKSPLQIGTEVAATGALQRAGEAVAPIAAKGIGKAAEGMGKVSDWITSKIGKSFLKASKTLNAYGHVPEEAIKSERIFATSWDDLIDKIKIAKYNLNELYDNLFSSRLTPDYVDLSKAIQPINVALREAKKYPETNANVISKLSALKRDIIRRIDRSSVKISNYEVKPADIMPDNGVRDLQTTFGKEIAISNKALQTERYKGAGSKISDVGDDVIDMELTSTVKVVPAEIANNIKREIYKLTKYTGNPTDDAVLNKTKQYVASQINNEVTKVIPEIKTINIRYGNLVGLENAAEHRAVVASRSNILGIPEFAAAGAVLSGNVPAAVGIEVGGRLLTTPIGATTAMAALQSEIPGISAKVAQKIMKSPAMTAAISSAIAEALANKIPENKQEE